VNKNESIAYRISLGIILLLLIGALIFYKERMLFLDPAFITFEIINKEWFVFSEHRYGAFITQMFPLLAVKMGLSVQSILILYSASFYIFFFAVAFVSGSVLKQYRFAIALAFYLVLMASDVYFWPNNEIHQAVGWMILFLSIYKYCTDIKWKHPIAAHIFLMITLFLAIVSHPLVLIPLLYLWVYHAIDDVKLEDKQKIYIGFYSMMILPFIALRVWLSYNSWYDGAKLAAVKNVSLDAVWNTFSMLQAESILDLIFTKHWIVIPILLWGIYDLIRKSRFLHLTLTLVSGLVYYVLVSITFTNAITALNLFYLESEWMCLALIISYPFIQESIGAMKDKRWVFFVFGIIVLSKIVPFRSAITKFQNRLDTLEELTFLAKENKTSKSYLYKNSELTNALLMTWGVPIESILISVLKDELAPPVTIKIFDKKIAVLETKDSIYTAFKLSPVEELNAKYFQLDLREPYKPLTY